MHIPAPTKPATTAADAAAGDAAALDSAQQPHRFLPESGAGLPAAAPIPEGAALVRCELTAERLAETCQ